MKKIVESGVISSIHTPFLQLQLQLYILLWNDKSFNLKQPRTLISHWIRPLVLPPIHKVRF